MSGTDYHDWTYDALINEAKRCRAEFDARDADPVLGPLFTQVYELGRQVREGEASEDDIWPSLERLRVQIDTAPVNGDPWAREADQAQCDIFYELRRRGLVTKAARDLGTTAHRIVLLAKFANSR